MKRVGRLFFRHVIAAFAAVSFWSVWAQASVEPYLHTSNAPHEIKVLHDGLSAFEWRLEMIERAHTSIDLMVYLFQNDDSSRLTLHRLMDQAVRGVRVRLLVDYYCGVGHPDITEDIVAQVQSELRRRHAKGSLEVRYYNRGSILENLARINHRMHAKMMIVDGKEVLIGGRNIGDDYFSMIEGGFDYLDREIWARGPIATSAQQAFYGYWKNPDWVSATRAVPVTDHARTFVGRSDGTLREEIRKVSTLPHSYSVQKITLAIDQPGHARKDRIVTPVINRILNGTDQYLLVENYSLPMSDRRLDLFKQISERNVPMLFLTNSFESHDSPGVSAYSQMTEMDLLKLPKVWIWAFAGHAMPNALKLADRKPPTVFSTHTKTFVSFSAARWMTFVGTYNFDVRSEQTNNEAALIVEDTAVAKDVSRDILQRITQSHPLASNTKQIYYADTGVPETRDFTGIKRIMNAIGLGKLWRSLY